MVSKNQIKLIKSLSQKKFRNKYGLFVVEGLKAVGEFLNSDFQLHSLYTSGPAFDVPHDLLFEVSENDLKKISFLKTPQQVLAVFYIPGTTEIQLKDLTLLLDGIRDPGNLGTIIRLCDWYGIENLICSQDTVDCFNPKVVQATMGSLTRVNISYLDLPEFLNKETEFPVYGAMLEGENIYKSSLIEKAFIVMGNEANGVSSQVESLVSQRISIPQFGAHHETESLNVATATAIILSEFRRNLFTGK